MAVSIQGTPIRTGFSTSRSPGTGSISSYTPLTDDVIATWVRAGTAAAAATVPATWVNPLGGNTLSASGGCAIIALYHFVTSAEETAGTVAWTLTNLWNASQTGAAYTLALRGVDTVNPVDAFGSANSGSSVSPHVLAGLTGTDLLDNSLILSGVGGDTSTTYSTAPTGWTFQVKNGGGQNTGALLTKDALSVANTTLSATNITPGTGSNYASITLAYAVPAATANTTAFFSMF